MVMPDDGVTWYSIPNGSEELITDRYASGAKQHADYLAQGERIGWREFYEGGSRMIESPLRNGRQHGQMLEWYESGQLSSATTYVDGREHGTARQWADDGTLVGSYEMDHGTGLDLWWTARTGNQIWRLSEARYLLAGDRHGFEWWINDDQQSVSREGHFAHGREHGIQRD